MLAVAVAWGIFLQHAPPHHVALWSIPVVISYALRWAVLRHPVASERVAERKLVLLTLLTVANAVFWNGALFLWFYEIERTEQIVLLMLMAGQVMGSVAVAAHVRSFIADLTLLVLPLFFWLLSVGDSDDQRAAFLLFGFGLAMGLLGLASRSAFYSELAVRTELRDMVGRLKAANELIVQRMQEESRGLQELRSSVGLAWSSREPVLLNSLVSGMISRLERQHVSGARIEWKEPKGEIYVLADARQLEVAIGALVVNAMDALGAAQRRVVRLELHRVDRSERDLRRVRSGTLIPGKYAELRVIDQGDGMDPPTLNRAMEPFFTTRGVGRGIGLCIVANIATMHGGGVELDSTRGEGTTAVLLLPVVK